MCIAKITPKELEEGNMEIEDETPTSQQITALRGAILLIKSARNNSIMLSLTPAVQAMISLLETKEECYIKLIEGEFRQAVSIATTSISSATRKRIDIGKVEQLQAELYRKSRSGMRLEDAKNFVDT